VNDIRSCKLLRGGGSGDLKAVVFDEPLGFGNVLRCAIPPSCGDQLAAALEEAWAHPFLTKLASKVRPEQAVAF
jgi:hypothetical protein